MKEGALRAWAVAIRRPLLVLALLLPGVGAGLLADEDELGRRAPPAGIATLDEALERARALQPGRVLRVELDSGDTHRVAGGGRGWVYEVKMLSPGGHVVEIKLEATTLRVLEIEGLRERGDRHRRAHD